MDTNQQLLSCSQAAEYLGLPERTMRNFFTQRVFDIVRMQHRLFVKKSTLDEFVETSIIKTGQR